MNYKYQALKNAIDFLYSKDKVSDFQKDLRLYMMMGWAKKELQALKKDI